MKLTALILMAVFALLDLPLEALKVNIISKDLLNAAGKEVDAILLKTELENQGHAVRLFDYRKENELTDADINIFLAQFNLDYFPKAKLNWLLANPDFYVAKIKELKQFDLILCKTEESLRIFQSLGQPCYYLGFTSKDCYQSHFSKDYSKFIHVAGKSVMKGTEEVYSAWIKHPELTKLTLIKRRGPQMMSVKNIKLITRRVSENYLLKLQNRSGIHICPSKTEGFGHYIMEAMSAGCVVVTTDAPPMNEFIKDKRCLAGYSHTDQHNLSTIYIVDEEKLVNTVKALQLLSIKELEEIGEDNRKEYLRRKAEFKQNFRKLMEKVEYILPGFKHDSLSKTLSKLILNQL